MSGLATYNLGEFLRSLRKEEGLTLEQAARAAGIGRVTLNRWETGVHQPRLPELEALLGALRADPQRKRQALALMDAPRARKRTRALIAQIGERAGIGPMPNGGDLLRAMRMRRGLSREAAAERIGVSTRTLRRWETA